MVAYVYFLENKITKEFYYGSRYSGIKPENDLWKKYFSSSKYVKELCVLHGRESFDFRIILENEDYNLCFWYEQELIKKNIDNLLCLNKQYQDKNTKNRKFSSYRRPISAETRKKLSNSHKNKIVSDETKQKQSKIRSGRSLKTKPKEIITNTNSFEVKYGKENSDRIRAQQSIYTTAQHKQHPRKGSKNANAKIFEITDPSGNKFTVCGNMSLFCKENNLNQGLMIMMAKGRRDYYKGWSITYEQ